MITVIFQAVQDALKMKRTMDYGKFRCWTDQEIFLMDREIRVTLVVSPKDNKASVHHVK